jgi:hypothetical protein
MGKTGLAASRGKEAKKAAQLKKQLVEVLQ